MLHQPGRILDARQHIRTCERRIGHEQFVNRVAGGEKFQNRSHSNARPADRGLTVADSRINDDAFHASIVTTQDGFSSDKTSHSSYRQGRGGGSPEKCQSSWPPADWKPADRRSILYKMSRVIDAIYTNGHLEPVEPLDLAEHERVTLILQSREHRSLPPKAGAIEALLEGIMSSTFRSGGTLPSREELHDRL